MAQQQTENLSQLMWHQCSKSKDKAVAWKYLSHTHHTFVGTLNQIVPHLACRFLACTLLKGSWGPAPSYLKSSSLCLAKLRVTVEQSHSRLHSDFLQKEEALGAELA